jgi:hypothetical protein
MNILLAVIAALSIWDYPARQPTHEKLRRQFMVALKEGDTISMEDACRKGVALLPDDPTWHYNLACSLAYFKNPEPAFDELEKAIDLGFRDADAIERDNDLRRIANKPRFRELVEYARQIRTKPIMLGPMANVPATGIFGKTISLGEQNLSWDFDHGCFVANMKLATASAGGNTGDLYFNRDAFHSVLPVDQFPGLTGVRLDQAGRDRQMDLNFPNILFPYPVFGNCSRAFVMGPYWRSMSRALMTTESHRLKSMVKFYLSNQIWVFPSNADTAPVGTNGDVFASITPYWLTTAGRSFSDLPYLRAALEASRNLRVETKKAVIAAGMLSPVIQTLIRKSLNGVESEEDYLSPKAHPTAMPPNAVDIPRLAAAAKRLEPKEIPPLAMIRVTTMPMKTSDSRAELTYASAFAWAFVLRAEAEERVFHVNARGAKEFAFVKTHGDVVDVRIEKTGADSAKIVINRRGMSPTNRVDVAVFGRNEGTLWGAPSYISFARMDNAAPYSDPVLTTPPEPKGK